MLRSAIHCGAPELRAEDAEVSEVDVEVTVEVTHAERDRCWNETGAGTRSARIAAAYRVRNESMSSVGAPGVMAVTDTSVAERVSAAPLIVDRLRLKPDSVPSGVNPGGVKGLAFWAMVKLSTVALSTATRPLRPAPGPICCASPPTIWKSKGGA